MFYNALIKRKTDPAAATFLLGLENLPLRAEKSLFDLAQWAQRTAGAGGLSVADPGRLIWRRAASRPSYLPPLSGEFAARFAAHLAEFGHITYDLDFMNPVPADYPIPMLDTLKVYLAGQGNNPYARQQAQEMQRAAGRTGHLAAPWSAAPGNGSRNCSVWLRSARSSAKMRSRTSACLTRSSGACCVNLGSAWRRAAPSPSRMISTGLRREKWMRWPRLWT